MAISTITVGGIDPSLNILGALQQLNYNQPVSTLQVNNIYIPTSLISAQTNLEFRNKLLSGFRWIHTTSSTDTYGSLVLTSFINNSSSGTNLIGFSNTGINVYNNKITNLATPTVSTDGATKAYVDSSINAGVITLSGAVTGSGNINTTITTTLTAPAYCSIIMASNATATTVTTAGTYYKVAGTTTTVFSNLFSSSSSPANRMIYTGTSTTNIALQVSGNASHNAGTSLNITFTIFKNGSAISSVVAPIVSTIPASSTAPIAINTIISMATNDYIEVFVTASSNATNVTVSNLNFTAKW